MDKYKEKVFRPNIIRVGKVDIEVSQYHAVFVEKDIEGIVEIDGILMLPDIPLYFKLSDGEYWVENG